MMWKTIKFSRKRREALKFIKCESLETNLIRLLIYIASSETEFITILLTKLEV